MTRTDKVLLTAIGGLLVYETYTLFNKDKNDTESESVWRALPRRPIVSFALGAVVSHFVWQDQDVYDKILKAQLKAEMDAAETIVDTDHLAAPI